MPSYGWLNTILTCIPFSFLSHFTSISSTLILFSDLSNDNAFEGKCSAFDGTFVYKEKWFCTIFHQLKRSESKFVILTLHVIAKTPQMANIRLGDISFLFKCVHLNEMVRRRL